jgi:hypothetical protein
MMAACVAGETGKRLRDCVKSWVSAHQQRWLVEDFLTHAVAASGAATSRNNPAQAKRATKPTRPFLQRR